MKYDDAAYRELSLNLKIERDQLDEELIAQAQHFWHVAEAHEMAVSVMDRKKRDMDELEADLDRDVREERAVNEEKVTDKIVAASIERDQYYRRAFNDYLEAKRMAGRWGALRESFRQRRDMLRDLSVRSQRRYTDETTGAGDRHEALDRFGRKRS